MRRVLRYGACPAHLARAAALRVDRLPAEARRLLQAAAVLGAVFDETLLRDVAAIPGRFDTALARLVEAEIVQPIETSHEERRYRFTHALVHEVAYQNLLLSRRTEIHEQVGRLLERAAAPHPERLSDLQVLGHHWSLSSDKARGARYLVAAGDRARAVYANDDAIRHYERALRTLAECSGGDAEARAARERLADLLGLTGRRPEAIEHYEAVRKQIGDHGDRAAAARVQRKIGGLHWEAGERERAGACSRTAWRCSATTAMRSSGRTCFRRWAGWRFAPAITTAPSPGPSGRWPRPPRGHEAADAEGAREAVAMRAHAYNTLGVALARTGRLAEAVAQIERSIALAEARDLPQAACRGYTNLGVLYSSLDPRRSIETCLRGLETAQKVGDLAFQSRLYANLAVAYCALTDRCEAEGITAAKTAIDLDPRLGLLDHLAVPLIVLGQIHQCHGEHQQARAMYEEALGLAEQIGEPQFLFPCYDGLATLSLDAGDQAGAEAYLAKAQQVCERAGVEPDALMVLPFLC